MTEVIPTAEFASLVYGPDGVGADDPAETFHEASRLYPNVAPARLETLIALNTSSGLQQTVARASRTHRQRPGLLLRPQALPGASLGEAIMERRSRLTADPRPLAISDLSALLGASYGATTDVPERRRRPVPSAGALYPLELYVLTLEVDGVEPTVFHYDPYAHRLEALDPLDPDRLRAAVVDAVVVDRAAAAIVVTAVFWRSRFKYGLRGYRFALLEAGHLVQNATLAAEALDVAALPLGGFYDRRLDALVGADGLDEATVYALLLGGSA